MNVPSISKDTGDNRVVQISHLTLMPLEIPFRQAFTHASATRTKTETVLVRAESAGGLTGIGEGCPRHYVTGETVASAQGFFQAHRSEWMNITTIEDLRTWTTTHADLIDRNPAAWCAVETACLDLLGRESGRPIELMLGGTHLFGPFQYSAVLGAENLPAFEKQLQQYLALGFTDFKLKITGDFPSDLQRIAALKAAKKSDLRVRLDANNLWQSVHEARDYLQRLDSQFLALEEPLQVGDYYGSRSLSKAIGIPIILDESFVRAGQFSIIQDAPSLWIVNLRVSKMGGLLRALTVAAQAKALGIRIVVGAHVGETSILTRTALTVADQYRGILMAQEGAFGTHLLEYDICDPPLMFSKAGRLSDISFYGRPGLGLSFSS